MSNQIQSTTFQESSSINNGETAAPAVVSSCSKWYDGAKPLGPDFIPGPFDVICARGKAAYNHSGNKYFRSIVEKSTSRFGKEGMTYKERSAVVTELVNEIRSKGTGFVKRDNNGNGDWMEVGDLLAREKVGQMFRNALSSMYKSSAENKIRRRRQVSPMLAQNLHRVMMNDNDAVRKCVEQMTDGYNQTCNDVTDNIFSDDKTTQQSSDEELLAMFNQGTANMLQLIKEDKNLVHKFQEMESSASKNSKSCNTDNHKKKNNVSKKGKKTVTAAKKKATVLRRASIRMMKTMQQQGQKQQLSRRRRNSSILMMADVVPFPALIGSGGLDSCTSLLSLSDAATAIASSTTTKKQQQRRRSSFVFSQSPDDTALDINFFLQQ